MKVLVTAATMLMVSALLWSTKGSAQPGSNQHAIDLGRAVYAQNCASCHGSAAMGDGPAASVLMTRPPDLTLFTDRDKPFPLQAIRTVITGHIRRVPFNRPIEMPMWRDSLDARPEPGGVTELEGLLAYLESMQLREYGPYRGPRLADLVAEGATLFKTHCSSCHGTDGRGPSTSDYVVGIMPNLTTIATRHGGFELRKVYESIARCDEGSDAFMPSFPRSFKRAGASEYQTMKSLEALATYVESIQR